MIEFEFESTPETDAMLKQICVKECFVRCKDCKYWITKGWLTEGTNIKVCNRLECLEGCDSTCWDMEADDFCSRGERRGEEDE